MEKRRRSFGIRGWLIAVAVLLVVLLLSARGLARIYTDYLWFQEVHFGKTWRGLIEAKAFPALDLLAHLLRRDVRQPRSWPTGWRRSRAAPARKTRSSSATARVVQPYAGRIRFAVVGVLRGRDGERRRVGVARLDPVLARDEVRHEGSAVPPRHRLLRLQAAVPGVHRGLDVRGADRGPDRHAGVPLPQRWDPPADAVPAGDAAGEGAHLGDPRPDGAHQDGAVLPRPFRAHALAPRRGRRRHLHRREGAAARAQPADADLDRGRDPVHRQHLPQGLGVPDHRGRACGASSRSSSARSTPR